VSFAWVMDDIVLINTGKKFGVTDFVNSGNCGDKSVSQVFS